MPMEKKTIVITIGIILVIAGAAFMTITEPAGEEGSEPSWGTAGVSEDTRPYFLQGLLLLGIGIITVLIALVKMV